MRRASSFLLFVLSALALLWATPTASLAAVADEAAAAVDEADQLLSHAASDEDDDDDVDLADSTATDLETAADEAVASDLPTSTLKTSDEDSEETSTATPLPKLPYEAPSAAATKGLDFVDTFDGDLFSRWVRSANPKFSGTWKQLTRETEALEGDLGLRVMDEARHHGISTLLGGKTFPVEEKPLTVSYEAKFEEGLMCGGAYMKLFDVATTADGTLATFDNETPYVIMFGPDVCGATNKVHLILKHLNPISKGWTEHHLTEPPRVPYGRLTHQYAFTINPDDTFNLYIDGKVQRSGSLHKDFEPPFTPPKEIDDPEDRKPDDWVDVEEIPDPDAKRPEDWDETAPRMVEDTSASMPEGWLVDEPARLVDETATKPEDWDAAEKGAWKPPMIPNPKCENAPGCGPWSPPLVSNPAYKGLWTAPMVPNPAYKGPWKVRRIANPNYFENKHPHNLASFNAAGFELWTMQRGLLFDNLVVTASTNNLTPFLDATYFPRHKIEDSIASAGPSKGKGDKAGLTGGRPAGFFQKLAVGLTYFSLDHPTVTLSSGVAILVVTVLLIVKTLRGKRLPASPPATTVTAAATSKEAIETPPATTPTANAAAGATDTTAAGGEQPAAEAALATPTSSEAEPEEEQVADGEAPEEEDGEATSATKADETAEKPARKRKPRKAKPQED